jgi:hypothetical protein
MYVCIYVPTKDINLIIQLDELPDKHEMWKRCETISKNYPQNVVGSVVKWLFLKY